MKKKDLKGFVTGLIVATLVFSMCVPAIAKSGKIQKELTYSNISVTLDGQKLDLKDAKGNSVEPFRMDGTNYLPVRALAEALGLNVAWDSATQTVKLTTEEYTEPSNPKTETEKNTDIEATKGGLIEYLGTPVLGIKVKNNTSENIIRFDMKIACYDAYGELIDGFYSELYSDITLKPGVETEIKWDLLGSDGAYKVVFGVYKYSTASGNIVEIPEDNIDWKSIIKKS